jgi:hypothetical protein
MQSTSLYAKAKIFTLFVAIFISACGGGGTDFSPEENPPSQPQSIVKIDNQKALAAIRLFDTSMAFYDKFFGSAAINMLSRAGSGSSPCVSGTVTEILNGKLNNGVLNHR